MPTKSSQMAPSHTTSPVARVASFLDRAAKDAFLIFWWRSQRRKVRPLGKVDALIGWNEMQKRENVADATVELTHPVHVKGTWRKQQVSLSFALTFCLVTSDECVVYRTRSFYSDALAWVSSHKATGDKSCSSFLHGYCVYTWICYQTVETNKIAPATDLQTSLGLHTALTLSHCAGDRCSGRG